jgi:hypothetical protein
MDVGDDEPKHDDNLKNLQLHARRPKPFSAQTRPPTNRIGTSHADRSGPMWTVPEVALADHNRSAVQATDNTRNSLANTVI